ncbi:MAG: DUF3883 domain-containing protein [Rhizobiaceae bacterium]|nr:DUF3883 domain-containing protein [Rhizobiaceae bacterium]
MTVHPQAPRTPVTLNYLADLCGNIEQALKALQGYGVMALELIQNADDAHATTLTIDARKDTLVVRNDATFTTCGLAAPKCPWEQSADPNGRRRPCNFHAISMMGGRSKVFAPDQIGRFGIGFVSVYQITDTPIIRSAGTQLLLNPYTGEATTQLIEDFEGTEFELPWASTPSDIRDALNASVTPPDVASLVVEEVSQVVRTSLLFLRHLERVEILQDGILRLSATIKRGETHLDLVFGPEERTERWMMLSRDASDLIEERGLLSRYEVLSKLDRSPIVNIAIPVGGEPAEGLIYAYLPTRQSTGMPMHVNGDFFPHASRQNIVLSGEGHERYWNELLLATAAVAIGDKFELLRDTLGHKRLWEVGRAAFNLRGSDAFSGFWKAFSDSARAIPSVWINQGQWRTPDKTHMAPPELSEPEQSAVSSIGIDVLHPDLRSHWTELSVVGVAELRLSTIVASLEVLPEDIVTDAENLRTLWAAVAAMIDLSRKRTGFDAEIKRLRDARFVLNLDGQLVSPSSVWGLPKEVSAAQVLRYAPDCPIVHPDVMIHEPLSGMLDELSLDEFASILADDIDDSTSAERRIGTAPEDVRALYELLTGFPEQQTSSDVGSILANTPFLWTANGFVSPSKGQLPGGFHDPIGHFEFVDARLFPPGMETFCLNVLDVAVLSFRDYIDQHLEDILLGAPSRKQYGALLTEIVEHRNQLNDEGTLELLAEKDFVRTRSGAFVQPNHCYYWSAGFETLLGDDNTRWVDESWIPASIAPRFRDVLEHLGMPTGVSARHIVDRIGEIANDGTPDEVVEACTPIIRHVIDRWARFSDAEIETLGELRHLEFLPAQVDGERDSESLYSPDEVYRAGRALGFASQVPVVDLAPLRQSGFAVSEFLNLLEMPSEPSTRDVVAHLQHCMQTGLPASDLTYAILNERVEREDDVESIDELLGTNFIFDADLREYLPAGRIFWSKPPFGGYWHRANGRMQQREALYRRLGVEDEPAAQNYAALILEIVRKPERTEADLAIHARCLGYLADALERGDEGVDRLLEKLRSDDALINVDGEPTWPGGAIWLDSEHLADPFGDELNERLVRQPDVHRTAAARLFRRLGTTAISDVAHLRLAAEPDNRAAPDETDRLKTRADLLLWLAPNTASRLELKRILQDIQVRLTDSLRIRAEITEFDPPVTSRASDASAFYEFEASVLHVKGIALSTAEWTAAFRALFSQMEKHCLGSDVKPLITTASLVMLLSSHGEAEQTLRCSDFRPPDEETDDIPLGDELGELDYETVLEDEHCEPAGSRGTTKPLSDTSAEETGLSDGIGSTRAGFETGTDGDQGTAGAAEFRSKGSEGDFGSETHGSAASASSSHALPKKEGSRSAAVSRTNSTRPGETRSERRTRRSRMLAYVGKAGARGPDDSEYPRSSDNVSELIDAAAIAAALKYEEQRGWTPEEQPHGNPGYDILSTSPQGKRRLIEVKGLEADWTERGVKLSHVQYNMAENHPEEYWFYVVENARDLDRQRVNAISNPFSKVEEYWFDNNWRDLRDEYANSLDLNIIIGAKIKHKIWETGTIVAVERKGIITYVNVDFGLQGKKYIPYNDLLTIVD